MIRSGAKGRRITICDSADRMKVIEWMKAGEPEREEFVNNLAAKAEWIIARYCGISAGFHSEGKYKILSLERVAKCAYGENAWQQPAYFNTRAGNDDKLAISEWILVAGQKPSFNNYCDLDRMIQTVTHIGAGFEKGIGKVPFIAIGVKHGNACGAAFSYDDPIEAVSKMLQGDLQAIFGGMVMVNFPVNEHIADMLIHYRTDEGKNRLLDTVAAPSFSEEAIGILSFRKEDKCRLLANENIKKAGIGSLDTAQRYRYVRGGMLEQPNYTFVPKFENEDIILAWAVCATTNSNTITIVKDKMLLGNGVGQQDRVGAAKLAISRADWSAQLLNPEATGADLNGAVACSDSFFPYNDGPEVLINRRIKTIFSTSGSRNDKKLTELCLSKGIELILLPDKEARGFYGH